MAALNPVRIRLRYPDLDGFVERFAPNVTRGGVFLASRNISPVGTIISFEILLVGGDVALAGQGKVSWVKEFNPAEPNRPYGMGVQFVSLEPASKAILARLLRAKELSAQTRRPSGPQPTVGIPSSAGNGKPVAPPMDTSVDLAAEYGVDDTAIRRVIDQTWLTGARGDDDLADLLKPDPVESVTLAQALADLPRLLDSHTSRRRASGGYRPVESAVAGGAMGRAVGAAAASARVTLAPAEATPPAAEVIDSPSGPTLTPNRPSRPTCKDARHEPGRFEIAAAGTRYAERKPGCRERKQRPPGPETTSLTTNAEVTGRPAVTIPNSYECAPLVPRYRE